MKLELKSGLLWELDSAWARWLIRLAGAVLVLASPYEITHISSLGRLCDAKTFTYR